MEKGEPTFKRRWRDHETMFI